MALPKKGFRSITVNDTCYKYKITGEDGEIRIILGLPNINGQFLIVWVSYHFETMTNPNTQSSLPTNNITPKTIRQAILYGLDNGWKPEENAKPMLVPNLEHKITCNQRQLVETFN